MRIHHYIWIFFLWIWGGAFYAQQIQVRNNHEGAWPTAMNPLWKGEIINQGQPVQAFAEATLSQDGEILHRFTSNQVLVGTGVSTLTALGLTLAEEQNYTEVAISGEATLCLQVLLLETGEVMARACQNVELSSFTPELISKQRKNTEDPKNSMIQRQPIQVQVTGQLSSWDDTETRIPGNFYQVSGNVPFSVSEVPVQLRFNYASFRTQQQGAWWRNVFQISLDQQQLMRILKERAKEQAREQVEQHVNLDSLAYWENVQKEVNGLSYYENKLNSPTYKDFEALQVEIEDRYGISAETPANELARIKDSLKRTDIQAYQDFAKYQGRLASYTKYKQAYEQGLALKEQLRLAEQQYEKARQFDPRSLASKDKLYKLLAFRDLQIGTVYPSFSPLTINGTALQGALMRYAYRNWQIDLAGGGWIYPQTIAGNDVATLQVATPPRLFVSRLIWGDAKGRQPYLGATFVYAGSDTASWAFHPDYTSATYQSVGITGGFPLAKEKGYIKGEWVTQLPTSTTEYAYSGRVEADLRPWKGGEATVRYQGRSVDFSAIANPWLLQPLSQYAAELNQSLMTDKWTLNAFARRDFITLLPLGSTPPIQVLAGVSSNWKMQNLNLGLSYAPVFNQIVTNPNNPNDNATGSLLSATSDWTFEKGGVIRFNWYNSIYLQSRQKEGQTLFHPNINSTLGLSLGDWGQIQLGGSYFAKDYVLGEEAVSNVNGQLSMRVWKNLKINGGGTSFSQQGIQYHQFFGGINGGLTRNISIQLNGSYGDIPIERGIREFTYEKGWFIRTSLQAKI
ncbi:MAG: hypothetical protein AAFW00_24120 [Bacteroidota bacterium]